MYHCAWPEVVWLPDLTWCHRKWRHKTESGWFPLGCVLICSRCCVVLKGVFYHVCVLTVVFLINNLRVKWMKWYIWSPKSPSRRSLCIYPCLWLTLYRGCINLLFFLFFLTCLTSNNTNLCTIPVASTAFSKSLVTFVMLCPAHRWMS
jgi:hypothetical protein